jgi:predicted transcriptional regulator
MYSGRKKNGGINTSILETLKEYNDKIPIDFLAKRIGREREEIAKYLEALEEKGVVRNEGNLVYISN